MTALGDITTPRLVRCWPDASLRDVAEQMVDEHVHAVFVIDETGEPLGIHRLLVVDALSLIHI